jgi:hypothetical protein
MGMRRTLPAAFALVLGACNAGGSAYQGGRDFGAGLGSALTAPLEDLNLRREQIPMVLLQAEANPYDLRNLTRCSTIAAEIERLDEALGPDTDEPAAPDQAYLSERAADAASGAALAAIRDATTDFIPGRSWIRRLTGAEQHSQKVQAAIQAGRMRRAFLKGVGMQRNCRAPAAPRWFVPQRG